MSTQDTSIQQSALVTPIDGLSLPSANLVGQFTQFSTPNTAPVYRATVNQASGPFLADTAENIQLFTDIFNSGKQLENTINGVVQDDTLETFLYSTLGVARTVDVEAICAYIDEQTYEYGGKTEEWFVSTAALAEIDAAGVRTSYLRTKYGARYIGNYDAIKGQWVQLLAIINAIDFGNSSTTKDGTCYGNPGDQKKKNWYWADKCGSLANGGIDLHTISENTACRDNATAADIASGYMKFSEPRTLYNLAISLDEKLTDITGLDASSPPSTLSISLPVTDANIQSVFVSASDANEFSSRSVDVRVNPDSIQVGPSDPTRLIKVFNTKKFNFTDDTVALSDRAPTVLQSLNLIDRKAEKNFALADSVESAVWSTGVGDWRNSQSDDPNITAQLSAAGYTESGSQALRRLNLIPVTSGDKIQVLSADSTGSPVLVVDTSSQVNLLEAIWTSWKNIMELNTDIYGVTATHMPELSSIALNEALSGQSVIEILNNFHTTLQQIGSGGSGLTLSGLSDFVELSGRVHTNSTNITTLSTNMMLMSACCGTNAYNLSALSAEVTRLSKTNTLSSLITMLSTIDTLTLIQRLSGLTQDFTTILQLSTDVYNLSGSIGIQNEEIERLKLVLQPLYDVDLYDLEFCCETNRQSISALELRMDTLSLSALSGLNDIFNAVNLSTYITRLSSIEQTVAEFEDVRNIINNVTTNTINISSNVTTLSALSSNVYSQIQELRDLIPGSTDAGELSALTNIINSITDISVFLQQLSTDERMIDLELCCEENRVNIGNFTTTLSVLSSAVNNNIITINSLSGLMSQPAGVVLTTKNQTVSGHKTFKNTLVVESSGHFHNNMTLGDMSQPKIFNICSDNGTTLININGLPSQLNINELSPGDMYTVDINGHKVLAIK